MIRIVVLWLSHPPMANHLPDVKGPGRRTVPTCRRRHRHRQTVATRAATVATKSDDVEIKSRHAKSIIATTASPIMKGSIRAKGKKLKNQVTTVAVEKIQRRNRDEKKSRVKAVVKKNHPRPRLRGGAAGVRDQC
jgi:hypothetical protein